MDNNICHTSHKYKICVSGAAETGHCGASAFKLAEEIGREIVRHNAVLVDGATTGFPFWAAKGAKQEGGIVIGISPAATEKEHIQNYQLPIEYHDMIIYTGFNYSGRNLLLIRSSDAVIFGCGRMGTLNEFTICFEDDRLIGVLEGTGGTADMIREIIEKTHKGPGRIIYEKDPKKLVEKICRAINEEREEKNNHKKLFKGRKH